METDNIPHIKNQIDFEAIFKLCLKQRRLYYKVGVIVFIFSAIYVFSLPRYYRTVVKLAPEDASGASGGLASLASMVNVKLGGTSADDAIYPEIYPELFSSKQFLVSLFDIRIHRMNDAEEITLFDYIQKKQRIPFWQYPINLVKKFIGSLKKKDALLEGGSSGKGSINRFHLSLAQDAVAKSIGGSLSCLVDKRTDMITLSFMAQDPIVSALVADSVQSRLQRFITQYRTNKARVDVEYAEKLLAEAKAEYDTARQRYSQYADTHDRLYMASYKNELNNLENEMQLAYNVYSQVSQQLQLSKAKLQERTPAFTTIEAATVPLVPAGPKRVRTIVIFLFLAFVVTTGYIYFRNEKSPK